MTIRNTLMAAGLAALLASPALAQQAAVPPPPPGPTEWRAVAPDNLLVIDTTKGRILVELAPEIAPAHVERIKLLTRRGFYDNTPFHRVIEGFMAQGGDPTGTGMHGSDKPNLAAEFSKEPHVRGVASMARAQSPNSANSQFFICFDDARFLDGQYTVWGEVTSGMEYVDALPKGEPPREPGKIVKARAE